MTVLVRSITLAGIGRGSSTALFTDNFTRANTDGWGPNWITQLTNSNNFPNTRHAIAIVGNKGRAEQVAVAGSVVAELWPIPLLPILAGGTNRNQFSQIQTSNDNDTSTNSTDAGVAYTPFQKTFANPSLGGGYLFKALVIAGPVRNMRLDRRTYALDGTAVDVTLASGFGTWALGDTLRLEAIFSGGNINLTCKQNGTTVQTFSEATTLVPGGPMIELTYNQSGYLMDLSSYSGGLL